MSWRFGAPKNDEHRHAHVLRHHPSRARPALQIHECPSPGYFTFLISWYMRDVAFHVNRKVRGSVGESAISTPSFSTTSVTSPLKLPMPQKVATGRGPDGFLESDAPDITDQEGSRACTPTIVSSDRGDIPIPALDISHEWPTPD